MCKALTDIYTACCGNEDTIIERCPTKKRGAPCTSRRVSIREMETIRCAACTLFLTIQPKSVRDSILLAHKLANKPLPPLPTSRPSLKSRTFGLSMGLGLRSAGIGAKSMARKKKAVAEMAFGRPVNALRAMDGMFGHDGMRMAAAAEAPRISRKRTTEEKVVAWLEKVRV